MNIRLKIYMHFVPTLAEGVWSLHARAKNFLANKFQLSYKRSFEVILISKVKLYVGDFPIVQFCHFLFQFETNDLEMQHTASYGHLSSRYVQN